MDYRCFVCKEKFSTINETIKHLRKYHTIKENDEPILCISNEVECKKYFYTFSGLRHHLKSCIKTYSHDQPFQKVFIEHIEKEEIIDYTYLVIEICF